MNKQSSKVFSSINAQTILNAVTGYPLSQTQSPQLHELIYKSLGINAVMLAFPKRELEDIMMAMRTLPIQLLAVTIPHKQEVMKYLDTIDETAQNIGAVNTVIYHNGKLYGYNTDVIGIEHAFKSTVLKGKKALILGAGGVARSLCWFLQKQGASIFCLNRSHQKAEILMQEFHGQALKEKDLNKAEIDIIINATPVGMTPNIHETPLPKEFLRPQQTVFDLIYNPLETQLLKDAKSVGAKTIFGISMFIAQAFEQIRIWHTEGQTKCASKSCWCSSKNDEFLQKIQREFMNQIIHN